MLRVEISPTITMTQIKKPLHFFSTPKRSKKKKKKWIDYEFILDEN